MEEKIGTPSPFSAKKPFPEFLIEFKELCEKYGYDHWCFLVGQAEDDKNSEWEGECGPFISEGILGAMLGFCEEMANKHGLEPTIPDGDFVD